MHIEGLDDALAEKATLAHAHSDVLSTSAWDGTAYVATDGVGIYVGPVDPGDVPDGSVWIDTSTSGGGDPDPVPVGEETWTLDVPAAGTDTADDPVSLGVRFTVTAAGEWVGMRVWITPTAPTITPSIMAYREDTGARLALKQYVEPTPRGEYHDITFDAPIAVTPGVIYQGAVHTTRYGHTANSSLTLPLQSPSGQIRSLSLAEGPTGTAYGAAPALTAPSTINSHNYMHMAPIVAFS